MNERKDRPLGGSILTPGDEALIRRINDTAVALPDLPLLDRFAAAVARHPRKLALYHEGRSLTYEELDRASGRLAHRLLDQGFVPGEVAAICMAPQEGMLLGMIAVLKAGGAYLPIDTTFPAERIGYLLADAGVRQVLTSRDSSHLLTGPGLDRGRTLVVVDGGAAEIAAGEDAYPGNPGIRRAPQSACYVIYTSGSTGQPKGVVVEDASLLNFTAWYDGECGFSAEPDSATGVFVSFAFDSQVSTTLVPLLCGASVHVGRADLIGDFEGFLGYLDRHRLTAIMLTPSYMNMIVNALDPGRFPLACFRYLMLGAERASAETVRRWLATHPGHRVIHRYGPTEGTVACTYLRLQAGEVEGYGNSLPVGRPIGNARIHIVNPRGGLCPPRVKGEILIGGASVTRGYLGRPQQTAAAFVPDPFSGEPGARLYRTGDLGSYLPSGLVAFHGRGDDQVKIRGYRVELVEVEHNLRQHPGVELAAVLATDESTPGGRQLVGYYTTSQPTPPEELRKFLRGRVPEFMVPGRLHRLDAMPLLQHGKIDRQRLRQMAAEAPAAAPALPVDEEPRSEIERRVAGIVGEALGLSGVPLHTSFFDLGANSLTLARLHFLLGKEYPGRVSLAELFGHSSVSRLAALLAGAEPAASPVAVPAIPAIPVGPVVHTGNGLREIAIIGMAGRFPGAQNLDELWSHLAAGRCDIGPLPPRRLEVLGRGFPRPVAAAEFGRGGYLAEIDRFDPLFFNISPGEAELIDPQQRLFLEVVYETLETAGYASDAIFGSETGVFVSDSVNQYGMILPRFEGAALPGNRPSVIAGRTAYTFDLHGPTFNVDTACSSGLVALHLACAALRNGECDLALVGGSDLVIAPLQKASPFADAGIASKNETLRPFDAEADGTVRGEGVVAMLVKPLDRALVDGDHVWAVIRGSAVNHDGLSNGVTAPNPVSQARAIVRALEVAGVSPESISYVEGHGSGTRLGDPIEIAGLTAAYRRYTDRRGFCPIGSVKANIGHLNNLAGLVGLVKTVLALRARTIPPAVGFERPNPYIDFAGAPVYVSREGLPWVPPAGHPRRAGVNSFGLSGTNCHTIVEEAPVPAPRPAAVPRPLVFALSAKSEPTLAALLERWRRFLAEHPEIELRDLAFVTTTGRGHFKHRLAVVATTREELDRSLARLAEEGPDPAAGRFAGKVEGVDSARTFFSLDREAPAGPEPDVADAASLARHWITGTRVRWETLFDGTERRLPLPTYPFEGRPVWVEDTSLQASLLARMLPDGALPQTVTEPPAEAGTVPAVRLTGRAEGEAFSEVERRVAESWGRVLKVEEIGVEESFFNLGNSLMMMQLGADLRERLGLEFPAIKLARLPTIARFSAYAEGLLAERVAPPASAATLPAEDLAPLVRLSEAAAPEVHLVCLPYSGGEVSSFYQLAGHLPATIGAYALAMPRFDPEVVNLENIVDRLLEPVAALLRRGPTVLFGHSMGGLLAHRLAQKLEAAGLEPAALIFSSTSPGHFVAAEKQTMLEQARQMAGLSDEELLAKAVEVGVMRPADAQALARAGRTPDLRFDLALTFEFVPALEPRPRTRSYVFVGADDPLAAVMGQWAGYLGNLAEIVTLPGGHLYLNQHPEPLARRIEEIVAREAALESGGETRR